MASILFSVLVVFLLALPAAADGRRVALVIGNANYSAAPLANPGADATAIADLLRSMDFEVYQGLDLTHDQMSRSVGAFLRDLQGAEVALLYYAGHGIQLDNENFMIPVDTSLKSETEIELRSIKLTTVLGAMERSAKTSITFLDACRNNPFEDQLANSLGRTRSAGLQRGLAGVEAGIGSLVAFATAPNQVAFDGAGRHSPFTQALLDHLGDSERSISSIMTSVTADVFASTNQRQRPYTTMSLLQDVYLGASDGALEVAALGKKDQAESDLAKSDTREPSPTDAAPPVSGLREATVKPGKDRTNPATLAPFEIADGRIGSGRSHYWRSDLPAGDYRIVIDAERADDEHTFTSLDVDFLDESGSVLAQPLSVNGNYLRRRTVRRVVLPEATSLVLVIEDASAVLDYDFVIVPESTLLPSPYLTKTVDVIDLAVGERAEGLLFGHAPDQGEVWYRVALDASDYDIVLDVSSIDTSGAYVSGLLEALGPDAQAMGNPTVCRASGSSSVNTCAASLSLAESTQYMFRVLSGSGSRLRTSLIIKEQ